MTAILAIYHRNQKAADPKTVEAMLAPSRYRARDGERVWAAGHIALAHQHFWITPEEQGEEQPLVDASGRAVISFDGRLDNREWLAGALGVAPASNHSISDAQLALWAYLRWGEPCVERLLGDFAFVIWDTLEQSLFVARDALGGRDVLYYVDDALCLIASEASQLLAHPFVEPVINDGYLSAFLNSQWEDPEQSVFKDIYHCPPAHYMMISAEHVQKRRYWDVDPENRIEYRRDEGYADHFLALFTEAVNCRLRTNAPVGISISGGMDSPSVAVVAARLLAESGRGSLKSYSYVFDEFSESDERVYIEPVIAACGLDGKLIPGDDKWTLKELERWPIFLEFPGQDYLVWLTISVLEAAAAAGCRTLLTGAYGDALFGGAIYWAADVLRERRLMSVLPALLKQKATVNWYQDLVFNGLRLFLPEAVRAPIRRVRPRRPVMQHPGLGPRLQSLQAPNSDQLSDRLRKFLKTPGRWQRYWFLTEGSTAISIALLRQRSIPFGIEYMHPYADRRLVEFVMAVPGDQLGWPLQKKRVLRQAMTGILPEKVRQRTLITSLVPLFEKGVLDKESEVVRNILTDPLIVQRGYVQESWLQKELQAGNKWQADGYHLWQCISLELWLKRWWP